MKKIACQYVIVRFAPYIETGEFANVGILMSAPKQRYFGFKLATKHHSRITHFFCGLKPKLYRETLKVLSQELERVGEMLKKENDIDSANNLFYETVRPREIIIRFSESRVVLADEPKSKLKELYAFYIERNFVTKPDRETVLEKGGRR